MCLDVLLRLVCAVTVACVAGCTSNPGPASDGGGAGDGGATFPADALLAMTSTGGLRVEVRTAPDQPPTVGVSQVQYRVTDGSGAARDDLTLDVVPWMPSMGHGASVRPQATASGGGAYVLTDVDFFMPGHWELRTTVGGAVTDTVTPAFDVR
jgi:hypothetical protein